MIAKDHNLSTDNDTTQKPRKRLYLFREKFMRILIAMLLCFTFAACLATFLTPNDVTFSNHSKIYKPLLIPKEISDAHPRIIGQLIKAIHKWESVAPVELHIIYDYWGPRDSTAIVIDIQPTLADPTGDNLLGYYNPVTNVLFLNKNMETNLERFSENYLYRTCLHELGHLLGLPHIIGKLDDDGKETFDYGGCFDIVLSTKKEAKKCIMFPVASNSEENELSEIEIFWVRNSLMHDLNLTSLLGTCTYEADDS